MSKKIFLLALAFLGVITVGFAQKGVMKFAKETHNFGKVEQGKPVTYVFEFKNTGTDPVVIADVQPVCGCTTPEWTRTPVLPGQTGKVTATFNAIAMGPFNKPVTVISNAEMSSVRLVLTGEVLAKEQLTATSSSAKGKKDGTK